MTDELASRVRGMVTVLWNQYRLAVAGWAALDDVYQDALVRVWRAGCPTAGALLWTVVKRAVIDAARHYVRDVRKQPRKFPPVYLSSALRRDGEGTVDEDTLGFLAYEPDWSGPDADALMTRLSPRERTITAMRAAGYQSKDAARVLGISESRVTQIMHRVQRKVAA